jgi:hypothetical protein
VHQPSLLKILHRGKSDFKVACRGFRGLQSLQLEPLGLLVGILGEARVGKVTFLAAPLAITLFGESLLQFLAVTMLVRITKMTALCFRASAGNKKEEHSFLFIPCAPAKGFFHKDPLLPNVDTFYIDYHFVESSNFQGFNDEHGMGTALLWSVR